MDAVEILLVFSMILISMCSIISLFCTKSLKYFIQSFFVSLFGIVIPIVSFLLSLFLVPSSKNSCLYGWIDCFHIGKLVFIPLILWSSASFYIALVMKKINSKITAMGILLGFISCLIFFIFGLYIHRNHGYFVFWTIIPAYVTIWYGYLLFFSEIKVYINDKIIFLSLLLYSPFLYFSILFSKSVYLDLPAVSQTHDQCFVVSASMKGHCSVVGPFFKVSRNNCICSANKQLIIFWSFEDFLKLRFPKFHYRMPFAYNRIGPFLARKICNKIFADFVYLVLKPLEILFVIFFFFKDLSIKRKY